MRISDYHELVQVPASVAVDATRRAGLPVSLERCDAAERLFRAELTERQARVEAAASAKGFRLTYSPAHAPLPQKTLIDFLYSPRGFGLEVQKRSAKTKVPSTDDEALKEWAAVGPTHRADDHPVVYDVLKVRSVAKGLGTHLKMFRTWRRADGCVHSEFHYDKEGTARLSASKPPVQQIPERADPEVAKLVKSVLVPRVKPWLGNPDDWDPRRHGWVAKCDVGGAEAVIRAACLARDPVASEYLRRGGDLHSKTASILHGVPEGTYRKGTPQRDVEGKQSFFLLIFGGKPGALRATFWEKARVRKTYKECAALHARFFDGYRGIWDRYQVDARLPFDRGWIEDPFGRRWVMPAVRGITGCRKARDGHWMEYEFDGVGWVAREDGAAKALADRQRYVEHCYANRPTQSGQASTTLWCHALLYHGEYVELRAAPWWDDKGGVLFPEAAGWQLHEGPGPGGKPFQAWINNTVHDAVWGDGAPGYLEPFAKVVTRRFNGVPCDFLLEADQPWRVEIQCGPDFGHLEQYNVVARRFGLEEIPDR